MSKTPAITVVGGKGFFAVGAARVEGDDSDGPDGPPSYVITEAQYNAGGAGWVRMRFDGDAPDQPYFMEPDQARALASELMAAATIADSELEHKTA